MDRAHPARRVGGGRGADHGGVTEMLEKEGARKFIASFDEMLEVMWDRVAI